MNQIGKWMLDEAGLPCFAYTGDLPYNAPDDKGQKIRLPEDPWFILGNYRITVFSHVSGEYELISGQRSWMRLNKGEGMTEGKNSAEVVIDGESHLLTGMSSSSASANRSKIHGCGFAFFEYLAEGILISRNLSVNPSLDPRDGASAFLLTVHIENDSAKTKEIKYLEKLWYNPTEIHKGVAESEWERICHSDDNTGMICKNSKSEDPLLFGAREVDGHPLCSKVFFERNGISHPILFSFSAPMSIWPTNSPVCFVPGDALMILLSDRQDFKDVFVHMYPTKPPVLL